MFTAAHPARVRALILLASYASAVITEDHPWGWTDEVKAFVGDHIDRHWGQPEGEMGRRFAPSAADDPRYREGWARFERRSASPAMAKTYFGLGSSLDARAALPAVKVPTLVVHRTGDQMCDVRAARYAADHIAGARMVELPGDDHLPWVGDADGVLDVVEEFLTGAQRTREIDRILATVLFTDIVDSTQRAQDLGDRAWRDLLENHDMIVRRQIESHRGREIKHTGDGVMAAFDGPARAVRCATSIREDLGGIGLEVRAGVHTGECELLRDGDLGGMAVHVAARVAALGEPGEVLATSTVKDLVAGSGLRFAERGSHRLKGIDDEWRVFSVAGA
jgi:class 3 adenylate cyclase